MKYLKAELYDSEPLIEEKKVVEFKNPDSINVENFVENMVGYT